MATINNKSKPADHLLVKAQQAIKMFILLEVDIATILTNPLIQEIKTLQEKQLSRANKLLNLIENDRQDILRFDPFILAGFSPNENRLSDALAGLLNPSATHGLGVRPLKALLGIVGEQRPSFKPRTTDMAHYLDQPQTMVSVRREVARNHTRPDIVISFGKYLIYIENKLRGGAETIHPKTGKRQIHRQTKDLKYREKLFGIESIGIFLSPEGKPPSGYNAESLFTPLSVSSLVGKLKTTLIEDSPSKNQTAILAFLDYYDWM